MVLLSLVGMYWLHIYTLYIL